MRVMVLGLLIPAVLLALPAGATAQPVNGFYIGGGLGAAFLHNQAMKPPAAPGFAPAPVPGGSAATDPAPAGRGSVGYGFGNGLRFELEGNGGANHLRLPQWP